MTHHTGHHVTVQVFPAADNLYWVECTLCGPVTLVDEHHCTAACMRHLREHGCEAFTP